MATVNTIYNGRNFKLYSISAVADVDTDVPITLLWESDPHAPACVLNSEMPDEWYNLNIVPMDATARISRWIWNFGASDWTTATVTKEGAKGVFAGGQILVIVRRWCVHPRN